MSPIEMYDDEASSSWNDGFGIVKSARARTLDPCRGGAAPASYAKQQQDKSSSHCCVARGENHE